MFMKLPIPMLLFLTIIVCAQKSNQSATLPPVIPIGLDAYLQWHKLPQHRIGVRAYMRGTYDRNGGNPDAGNFLYQESDTFNVTLDVHGPGIVYFKRTNHWHGSPWHYEIDGTDHIVQETATANPVDAKQKFGKTTFIPEKLFPNPLTWTWSITKGADLMWVPLTFENRLRFAYSRTFYGTGYYIYHLYQPGIKHLSKPLKTWRKTPPEPSILALIKKSGTDIAPKGKGVSTIGKKVQLPKNQWTTLAEIEGPGNIRALKFTIPRDQAMDFGKARLRIIWDDRWHASIDAPVALFYGAGLLHNSNNREYLVKGFPLSIRYSKDEVYLDCYWPMPFFKNARIEIQPRGAKERLQANYEIRYTDLEGSPKDYTYFHATYTDIPNPVLGQDNTFLDTRNVEGGGHWSGSFVGMSWIFSRNGKLNTLEGDPRFFFDDSQTPQGWGTGTEEWGGGGDYWGGENMTLPFAGYPVGKELKDIQTEHDKVNSAYRFLIADYFPFGKNAKINLEHGGLNDHNEHYSGVVYWYGIDQPTLVLTDELDVCNEGSIRNHTYNNPTAEKPYTLASRYELGVDHLWGKETYPPQVGKVRSMSGTSTFTMKLDPNNHGALLRRKFDYQYPNQKAKVFVRPADGGDWQEVGTWYCAGANTWVHSYPREEGELGQTQHNVRTSSRRWREEEFLLPASATQGHDAIEVRIEHIPNRNELFPGNPFPEKSVWSASKYWLYCYKLPYKKI